MYVNKDSYSNIIRHIPPQTFISVLSRLQLFYFNEFVKKLFSKDSIDFSDLISPGKLVLWRISKSDLPENVVSLLMSSIVLKLWFTVKERFATRFSPNPVFIIIDEFQNVQQLKILEVILSEARKFGLHLILSHQNLGQIRKNLLEVILGNTAIQVFFRLSGKDSKKVALEIDWGISEELLRILPHLGVGEAIIKVVRKDGSKAPALVKTRVFEGGILQNKIEEAIRKSKKYIIISECVSGPFQRKILLEILKRGAKGAYFEELIKNTGMNERDLQTILEYLKSKHLIKEGIVGDSKRYFISENISEKCSSQS